MARRRSERVRTNGATHVGFIGTEAKFTAPLLDFSPFGLSVRTSQEVEMGMIFRLGAKVDTDYFRAAGIVRRILPEGFAVEFLSMTLIDRQTMRRLYMRLQMAARAADITPSPSK